MAWPTGREDRILYGPRVHERHMETVTEDEQIYYCSFRELPAGLEAAAAPVAAFDVRERFLPYRVLQDTEGRKIVRWR